MPTKFKGFILSDFQEKFGVEMELRNVAFKKCLFFYHLP
jgi:hypothetical protein